MDPKVTPKPRLVSKLYWFFLLCLGFFMILRGLWALSQPWGVVEEKVFGMAFFSICFLWILYQFLHALNPASKGFFTILSPDLVSAIGCFAFVAGGIFLFVIGDIPEKIWGLAGIILSGFGGIFYLRRAYLRR